MHSKVIWIRCQDEIELLETQKEILTLIKKIPPFKGDVPIKVFLTDDFSTHSLEHTYYMTESGVSVLKEMYGDENVKICCKRENNRGYDEESRMDHLLNVLERMNDNLNDISTYLKYISEDTEEFSGCVSKSMLGGNRFCITGDVRR
ncbi:MAG: hypothetical protein PUG06_08650 [Blautia sp.]|uniref:hypothetical protein n=1 Tax=Blautia sp. TaxID=1955243 RepID=UPI0026367D78|nr:hypothetical protein [Blautia sp.]MDD6414118.1 hypothetical protein [Blautia sp.]